MSNVLVIGKNGEPLMPMKAGGQVRKLLKKRRAKVVCSSPFTIQLLYETKMKSSYYVKVGNLFMAKRKVDPNLISGMMTQLANQPAPSEGFAKSDDPNFPVWRGEVKKQFLVYVPMTPVRTVDGAMVADPLITYQHSVHANGSFSSVRCFNGLTLESLGFDGTCPMCEAAKDCSTEYFTKLTYEAKRLGIAENQIKDNPTLEASRNRLNNERVVKRAEEFITFPIVVLTEDLSKPLVPEDFKAYFLEIRRSTYEDKFIKIIQSQVPPMTIGCPETPFGKLFSFNYNYDSKGQEPQIRDAVRNVQYVPVTDAGFYNTLQECLKYAETLAAEFTKEKAVEVLKSSQLWYKDDYQRMTDNAMFATRAFLATANDEQNAMAANGIAQTLSGFNMGAAPPQIAPAVPTIAETAAPAVPVPTAAPTMMPGAVPTAPTAPTAPTMQAGVANVTPTMMPGAVPTGIPAPATGVETPQIGAV